MQSNFARAKKMFKVLLKTYELSTGFGDEYKPYNAAFHTFICLDNLCNLQ